MKQHYWFVLQYHVRITATNYSLIEVLASFTIDKFKNTYKISAVLEQYSYKLISILSIKGSKSCQRHIPLIQKPKCCNMSLLAFAKMALKIHCTKTKACENVNLSPP